MSRHMTRIQVFTLGAVVLAAFGLGAVGLFAFGARNGLDGSAFTVRAAFADIGGVEVGTPVRLQGLDAGEVEAILPPDAPGGKVVLRLRIPGHLRHLVNADAQVRIAPESLLTGKIVRIIPGQAAGAAPVADDTELATLTSAELTEELARATTKLNTVLAKVDATLDELRSGEGTLGKLVKNNDVYAEALSSLHDVRTMVNSVKQNSDAIKSLPVVRNYVVDPNKELLRPDCKRYRKWFADDMLFAPDSAVLTAAGKKRLDAVAGWLNEDKSSTQDVVIAAFADPKRNPDFAQALTQKQSEAVMDYLKAMYRIQRTGFWFWSNRSVHAIGCGNNPPPVPESETLPPARIELLVFAPQR